MGIYTNINESARMTSNYKDYEVFANEHANFLVLGMEAVAECEVNRCAFDKAIALEELSALEQTGSTDVLYEGISVKSIWSKIKMFFKKIIDKIQKIFHTFIAKMSAMFSASDKFAKKYKNEIKKNWNKVSSEWEFKGFKFSNVPGASKVDKQESTFAATDPEIGKLLFTKADSTAADEGKTIQDFIDNKKSFRELMNLVGSEVNKTDDDQLVGKNDRTPLSKQDIKKSSKSAKTAVTDARARLSDSKGLLRRAALNMVAGTKGDEAIDDGDFAEEITKTFRSGETTKDSLNWSDITAMYGTADGLVSTISNFDSNKKNLETNQKNFVSTMDKLISACTDAENTVLKDSKEENTALNEAATAIAALYKDIWGCFKEYEVAAFTGKLQAYKEAHSQAKAIAVKLIGLNKKMQKGEDEESKNESYSFSTNFIDNVELV